MKPIDYTEIDKALEIVQSAMEMDPNTEKAMEFLLDTRHDLVRLIEDQVKAIEYIEAKVKALTLPVGDYGRRSTLKVYKTMTKKLTVTEDQVIQDLQAMNLDPMKFMKLDTANAEFKKLDESKNWTTAVLKCMNYKFK